MDAIDQVDQILGPWQAQLGEDYGGYRNHVCRVVSFCARLHECSEDELRKVVLAGCFHDLGIWPSHTFAYLEPSIALARDYLQRQGLEAWMPEVELMIDQHHKLRRYAADPLVELFRRGDLVDFSLGTFKFGLPGSYVSEVKRQFPNRGFHKHVVRLGLGWMARHPLNPLPIAKW